MLQNAGPLLHVDVILKGDEVSLLSLSTLVYRGLTPLDRFTFDNRCIVTARSALQCHVQFMVGLNQGSLAVLEEYVNW